MGDREQLGDRVLVRLTNVLLADAETVADALARCEAADLFNADGRALWFRDGAWVLINVTVLQELASRYVVTKDVVPRDGKLERVFVPVVLTEQMARAILRGSDPNIRTGGTLPGGDLASRLPKVSAAALGLAA